MENRIPHSPCWVLAKNTVKRLAWENLYAQNIKPLQTFMRLNGNGGDVSGWAVSAAGLGWILLAWPILVGILFNSSANLEAQIPKMEYI